MCGEISTNIGHLPALASTQLTFAIGVVGSSQPIQVVQYAQLKQTDAPGMMLQVCPARKSLVLFQLESSNSMTNSIAMVFLGGEGVRERERGTGKLNLSTGTDWRAFFKMFRPPDFPRK